MLFRSGAAFFLYTYSVPLFTALLNSHPLFEPLKTHLTQVNTASSSATTKIKLAAVTPSATPSASPSASPKAFLPVSSGRAVTVPILMYHYIGLNPNPQDLARNDLSVAPDKFEAELNYLQSSGFTTIDFDTLYNALKGTGPLPAKPILLTFDDGYIDFFINAYPILQKYHSKATVFIPTGLMDKGYYLHWDQIKQMQSSGIISFQAHSVNHVNLAALSGDRLKYEIEESRRVLSSELGIPVDFFAYPYGASSEEAWAAVKAAGFKAAVGTWYGTVHTEGTQYDLPRVKISGHLDLQGFTQKIH